MNYNDAKELFNKLNIELTDSMYNKFVTYEKELLEWNEKINLTSITNDDDIWYKHFLDSATIIKYMQNGDSVIDVGTGAGFPGIPSAIILNSINVCLLDSLNKRIDFLKDVTSKIDVNNVSFVHARAEDAGNDIKLREKFNIATARAVANLGVLCEYCLPFVKVDGKFICMKSGNVDEEILSAKKAIEKLGGKISSIDRFNLPNTDIERAIIIIEKTKNTPKEFPRKAGTPSKNPIK